MSTDDVSSIVSLVLGIARQACADLVSYYKYLTNENNAELTEKITRWWKKIKIESQRYPA